MKNDIIVYKDAKKLSSFRELVEDSAKKFPDKNAFIIKEKIEKNPTYKYINYLDLKNDVDSLDFIEETAREKLDMYYPNERVYVDTGM